MILMKCPQCGRSAEVPESLADEGHQCYTCSVALGLADPALARRRQAASQAQVRGLLIGAVLGGLGVGLVGWFGGRVGLTVAGGVAGALVGVVWGFGRRRDRRRRIGGAAVGQLVAVVRGQGADGSGRRGRPGRRVDGGLGRNGGPGQSPRTGDASAPS
jgi:hypothetical protein